MAFVPWKYRSAQRCTHPPEEKAASGTIAKTHSDSQKHTHTLRWTHLEVWHQPPGLQVQRVLIGAQLPVHHLLVVELKLNVTAGRDVDLGLKGLHFLRISPVKHQHFSPYGAAERRGLNSKRPVPYLTMPAALPLARAWAYKFLATVFSFTEPTNTIPFTFLQQKA